MLLLIVSDSLNALPLALCVSAVFKMEGCLVWVCFPNPAELVDSCCSQSSFVPSSLPWTSAHCPFRKQTCFGQWTFILSKGKLESCYKVVDLSLIGAHYTYSNVYYCWNWYAIIHWKMCLMWKSLLYCLMLITNHFILFTGNGTMAH